MRHVATVAPTAVLRTSNFGRSRATLETAANYCCPPPSSAAAVGPVLPLDSSLRAAARRHQSSRRAECCNDVGLFEVGFGFCQHNEQNHPSRSGRAALQWMPMLPGMRFAIHRSPHGRKGHVPEPRGCWLRGQGHELLLVDDGRFLLMWDHSRRTLPSISIR